MPRKLVKGVTMNILCFARAVLTALAATLLCSCAPNPTVLIGQERPAIEDFTSVILLTEMPEGAEQIAVVRASSTSFAYSERQEALKRLDEKLQREAAKVGANVVVITNRSFGRKRSPGQDFPATTEANVKGIAVWID
jgi:hypothetical protein